MSQGRVIDIIRLHPRWTFRYPDLAALGEGVILVVEPDDPMSLPPIGSPVTVAGEASRTYQLASVEQRGTQLGFGIRGVEAAQICRGSIVQWSGGPAAT